MKKAKLCLIAALLIANLVTVPAAGQNTTSLPSLLSFALAPGFSIPLGRDAELYSIGGFTELQGELRMPFLRWLLACADFGYSYLPLRAVTSLSVLSGSAGAGVRMDMSARLSIRAFGGGGAFYTFINDGSGRGGAHPLVTGGADISYAFTPLLGLSLGLSYRNFIGLWNALTVSLGAKLAFPVAGRRSAQPGIQVEPRPVQPEPLQKKPQAGEAASVRGTGLEIAKFNIDSIFPVFFKYYNDHTIGRATLRNAESSPAEAIRVTFLVKQYMDNPQVCEAPQSLQPGEEKEFPLSGLFKSTILEISESTLVSANIVVEYTVGGAARRQEYTQAVRIYDRNAIVWDDDRRAAAFVTAKDPTILKFSKNIMALLKGKAGDAVNPKLLAAIGIHEALLAYGLSYVVDPSRPFSERTRSAQADFLQFPQQTLDYKAGDCDDLAILYCALLESVNVSTAFITIPGHIFMAFALGMQPDESRKVFLQPDTLIYTEGESWIPIEVTERAGGFIKAWQEGAKEWRENIAKDQAKMYPLNECWAKYESVGFSGAVVALPMPPEDIVVRAYKEEVASFINQQIYEKVSELEGAIAKAQDPARLVNSLGILYAQYGLYDRAEEAFTRLLSREYVPALVNMGNLMWKRGEPRQALGFYTRALNQEPGNAKALLCVARIHHDLENYGEAKQAYGQLKAIAPDLAQKFAYLDLRGSEATRAADATQARTEMVWEEEE